MRSVLCGLVLAGLAVAQAIDSRTEADLAQIRATTWDLLAGQFPQHGTAWWEARARQCERQLTQDPGNHALRVDLAVAYLSLRRFEEARAELQRVQANKPRPEWVLWNLGIVEVKQGRFAEALPFLRAALDECSFLPSTQAAQYFVDLIAWRAGERDRRPAGAELMLRDEPHMAAVVDPLLEMVQDQAELIFYRADLATLPRIREEDIVARTGFVRAWQMAPNDDRIRSRIRSDIEVREVSPLLERARAWVHEFQRVEAEMLRTTPVDEVDFKRVEAELEARGIRRFNPLESEDREDRPPAMITAGLLVLFLLVGGLLLWRRNAAAKAARR